MRGLAARLTTIACLLALSACTAHNPFILANTTDVAAVPGPQYPSHERRVLVTSATLPDHVVYRVVARIDVGKAWYGRKLSVEQALAARARELGADAVIGVETWFQPSGYSWWAPHGRGTAACITGGSTAEELQRLGNML